MALTELDEMQDLPNTGKVEEALQQTATRKKGRLARAKDASVEFFKNKVMGSKLAQDMYSVIKDDFADADVFAKVGQPRPPPTCLGAPSAHMAPCGHFAGLMRLL